MIAAAIELGWETVIGHHMPGVTHVHRVLQLDTVEGAVGATAAHGDVELEECGRCDMEVPRLSIAHPACGTFTSACIRGNGCRSLLVGLLLLS